ncbi:putative glutathione S-transferase [Nemania sp. FL0916]|nr:putative glutathione S-transferase [Nemania sp. FL0916]
MSTSKIVLFDIPSKDPNHAWSVNTWRTRLYLNYKGLDYETEWLEYPEIKPRFLPHFPAREQYTVPTIKLPDGKYIMDSWLIAEELEKLYPTPSLHVDSPLRARYIPLLQQAFIPLRPEILKKVPGDLLKPVNWEFWQRTRSESVGEPLAQWLEKEYGPKMWTAAAPAMQEITALLKENDGGPFFEGAEVSYIDFVHGGFLLMFRQFGEESFKQLLDISGEPEVHLKFFEALKPWTERDNY